MITRKVQEVFEEAACGHNQAKSEKDRKKGCTKVATPGAAAGGCAFDGAKIALQPIVDAAHLVHGPIACEGNSWDNRHAGSSGPTLYRTGFTTDISALDVIHGGERRLFRAIRQIIETYDPPAVFVYQTCVTAMIGDDIEAVCERARARFGRPVVPVNAPGFVGSKNLGNKLAGQALLDHVIGTEEPATTTPYDVTIIGDYNVAGEFARVRGLFEALGIRVLASITGDGRYHDIACAHRARVTMVVCSKAMIHVARALKSRYGIPYFEGSFYGVSDMSESLRQMTKLLVQQGAPGALMGQAEALILQEEARAWQRLAPYRASLAGKRVLLVTGGVKSWSVVAALREAGMEIVGTSVKKSTAEDKQRIQDLMGEDAPMIDELAPREMYRMLKEGRADILLSGGRSQFVALKAKVPWLDINQERHHAYAGYDGMVELVRQIHLAVTNPVWGQVRAPAPWETIPAVREAV